MHDIHGICAVRMAADTTPHPQTRPGIPEICSSPSSFYALQGIDKGVAIVSYYSTLHANN